MDKYWHFTYYLAPRLPLIFVPVVIECPLIDETTVATNLPLRKINVHLNGGAVTTLIFG